MTLDALQDQPSSDTPALAAATEDWFGPESLAAARRASVSLDTYLIDLARQDEAAVLEALCERLALPLIEGVCLRPERVHPGFLDAVPADFARRHGLVAVNGDNGDGYMLVASRPLDTAALCEVTRRLGPAPLAAAPKALIVSTLNQAVDRRGQMAESFLETGGEGEREALVAEITRLSTAHDLMDLAGKTPVVKLLNNLLLEALRMRASDVHFQPTENSLVVRYRIDGLLYPKLVLPKSVQPPLVSRIKVMAGLDIAEHRLAQDGRTTVGIGSRQVDVRVSVVPTADEERVVLRLLDKGARLYRLEDLGMAPPVFAGFERLIGQSHGIILVTGPTGSGKTTTLYAALQRMDVARSNIITIEDPIEYRLEGINQIPVSERKGMNFASALRSVLRQDPDIIMVGEIRDAETARMAIQSALTGHLVFSTLHTNDAASAATRLVDIGVEPYLVASSVIGIMAQRLVRRVCPHCAHEIAADRAALHLLGCPEAEMPAALQVGRCCVECLQAGYLDRVGLYELLPMSDAVRDLVIAKAPASRIKAAAVAEGMTTLRRDGLEKVLRGQTTPEEVLRITQADAEPREAPP